MRKQVSVSPAMLSFLDFYSSRLDHSVLSEVVVPFLVEAATNNSVPIRDKIVALKAVEGAAEKADKVTIWKDQHQKYLLNLI